MARSRWQRTSSLRTPPLMIKCDHCRCVSANKHSWLSVKESQLQQAWFDTLRLFFKLLNQRSLDCKAHISLTWFTFWVTDCEEGISCTNIKELAVTRNAHFTEYGMIAVLMIAVLRSWRSIVSSSEARHSLCTFLDLLWPRWWITSWIRRANK